MYHETRSPWTVSQGQRLSRMYSQPSYLWVLMHLTHTHQKIASLLQITDLPLSVLNREQHWFAQACIKYHKQHRETLKWRRGCAGQVWLLTDLHRGAAGPWLPISCRGQGESSNQSPPVTEEQALFFSLESWEYSLLPAGTAVFPLTSQAILPISCFASMMPLDPVSHQSEFKVPP